MIEKIEKRVRCPFCNKTTSDINTHHLPGIRFFPPDKENRKNLITIKGCKNCHETITTDEEYFVVHMAGEIKVGNRGLATHLWGNIQNGLRKGHHRGLMISTVKEISQLLISTKDGWGFNWDVDKERIVNYIKYLAKGLFYKSFNKVLNNDTEICVYGDSDQYQSILETDAGKAMNREPWQIKGNKIFGYKAKNLPNISQASVIFMGFFDAYPFVVITLPRTNGKLDINNLGLVS